jgi:hypothetical protein
VPRLPGTNVGLGPDGLAIYRPYIILSIELTIGSVKGPGLVDSGADNTLVPFEAIEPLGIDFWKLPEGPDGSGPGGSLRTRACQGTIRWDKAVLMTEFMVAEPGKGPDAVLLGRADFFKLYVPRFHWYKDPPVFDLDPVVKTKA